MGPRFFNRGNLITDNGNMGKGVSGWFRLEVQLTRILLQIIRAEGQTVHPAKGNALVYRCPRNPSFGPTGQSFAEN